MVAAVGDKVILSPGNEKFPPGPPKRTSDSSLWKETFQPVLWLPHTKYIIYKHIQNERLVSVERNFPISIVVATY